MTNKSRNRSKLHIVTKLHEGIKFYKAKTERRDKIKRRKFFTKGQIRTSYNFAPRVIFKQVLTLNQRSFLHVRQRHKQHYQHYYKNIFFLIKLS